MAETVSIEQWEHSKENVLPVKSGRKASELALVFAQKRTSSEVEQERKQFQENIANNLEDPLASWIEYYSWAKERFPNTRTEQLSVIQTVTKLFRNSPNYQQDERYLRLWIIYVGILSKNQISHIVDKKLISFPIGRYVDESCGNVSIFVNQ
jgi:checkpoint serine/threonine-protein kinase